MKRSIRFRVWDSGCQMFLQPEINGMHCFRFLEDGSAYEITPAHPDIVFQQFTGLTDKNGCNIYEGDLIKFGNVGISMEVIFDKGKFTTALLHYIPSNCEVIGNIFETPELINSDIPMTQEQSDDFDKWFDSLDRLEHLDKEPALETI